MLIGIIAAGAIAVFGIITMMGACKVSGADDRRFHRD